MKPRDIGSVICAYSLSLSFRLGSVIGEKRFKAPKKDFAQQKSEYEEKHKILL